MLARVVRVDGAPDSGPRPYRCGCERRRRDPQALDRHDPRARDGRGPEGERGPPGHGDGARAARLRPLPKRDAPQSGEPGLAEPRPVHPLRRPRLHPPVRHAAPHRLQPVARGAEALPAVGVADAGPSGALHDRGHRDDDRPARAGLRERRRLRDRRPLPGGALQPAAPRHRRPPGLRDLLRRRPDGGRQLRGRVARRPSRPRPARLLLRRQPHHDRRHDRAHLHDRGQGEALRGAGLARPVASRTPRTSPRSSARSARRRPRRSGRRS